jgi:hypothetical protein
MDQMEIIQMTNIGSQMNMKVLQLCVLYSISFVLQWIVFNFLLKYNYCIIFVCIWLWIDFNYTMLDTMSWVWYS